MTSVKKFVGFLVPFILHFKSAYSIFCYDCNSAYDPRCGETFDSFSLGVVNCSLRDPPEHMQPLEPTFCRIIKMEIYGKVRIARGCGYLLEENSEHTCKRQTGNGEVFVTYCTCDTDLCNSSSSVNHKMALILALTLYGLSSFKHVI